jgi:hypothetical protein
VLPQTYTATIVGKYKFEVEFPGGKRPAALKHPLKLPAGTTTQVRLTNESVFLNTVISVRGDADESKTVQAPALSSLTVYNSWNESCEILIDDRPAGYHPVTQQLVSGSHEDRVETQELLRAIWGDSAYRDPRAIDVHIRHLREKLEERPEEPSLILTVRGAGYRFREQ